MKVTDTFIDKEGNRRVLARKTINLDYNGVIIKTIPGGTVGGIINESVQIKDDSTIWIDRDSAIDGNIKIEGTVVLLGSSYLYNFNEDYINYNSCIYLEDSYIVDTNIDGSDPVYIKNSSVINTTIKEFGYASAKRLSNSAIQDSKLINFFDIDSCRITNSIISNIRLQTVYNIYCPEDVDWSFIQNSFIDSKFRSTIKLPYEGGIIRSKINICCGDLCFDRYKLINAHIRKMSDFITIYNIGPLNDITLFYRAKIDNEYKILVRCGCFEGDIDKFEEQINQTYPYVDSKYRKQYIHAIVIAKETIDVNNN